MAKISKAEKIRNLLKSGDLSVAQIAKRAGVTTNYVYMVRYQAGKKKGAKKAKGNGHSDEAAAPVSTASGLPSVTSVPLDEAITKLQAKLEELQAFRDSLANALSAL